ncbi:MAG: hypothetical protein IKB56_07070, partial [Clostridia bacterium]|nr:hypothetical protein [Clostridia bacterium]
MASCEPADVPNDNDNVDSGNKIDIIANELEEYHYDTNSDGDYIITGLKNEEATNLKLPNKV